MTSVHARTERHRQHHVGWLRAAVLGANDGLISTASLLVGVAAADATRTTIIKTGFAALAAGALSMASGEYISVSAQADSEQADIAKETREIEEHEEAELHELAAIYRGRGLSADLANQVAAAMHKHDALGAHLRDELALTDHTRAQPVQAALSSGAAFVAGALIAVIAAFAGSGSTRVLSIAVATLTALAALGILGARLGDANPRRGALRVIAGGAIAMGVTAIIGALIGQAV